MSTESASNIQDDPVDVFLAGLQGQEGGTDESAGTDAQPTDSVPQPGATDDSDAQDQPPQGGDTAAQDTPPAPVAFDLDSLDAEKQLAVFNKITGLSIASVDEARKYAEVFNEYPTMQKRLESYPTLVEQLKKKQDVMSYFPDETAYKVAQLAKKEEFRGKEGTLSKLLKADVSKLSSMDVVKAYAELNTPDGIKNPFRYTIKKIGLDPDDVIDNFDALSDDEQDLFNGFAAQSRKELAKIGSDIEVPVSPADDIEKMLFEQTAAAKDELARRRSEVIPAVNGLLNGITEVKVLDDFAFKLNMSEKEKADYADFVTEAVLSGDFNLATDEGKKELYEALMDEIWIGNRQKIVKAIDTHLRTKIEKEFREKYDNAAPLNRQTPPAAGQPAENQFVSVIESMVNERM